MGPAGGGVHPALRRASGQAGRAARRPGGGDRGAGGGAGGRGPGGEGRGADQAAQSRRAPGDPAQVVLPAAQPAERLLHAHADQRRAVRLRPVRHGRGGLLRPGRAAKVDPVHREAHAPVRPGQLAPARRPDARHTHRRPDRPRRPEREGPVEGAGAAMLGLARPRPHRQGRRGHHRHRHGRAGLGRQGAGPRRRAAVGVQPDSARRGGLLYGGRRRGRQAPRPDRRRHARRPDPLAAPRRRQGPLRLARAGGRSDLRRDGRRGAEVSEARTGKAVYSKPLGLGGGHVFPSLAAAGKYVFITHENGTTAVLSAGREYSQVARNKLEPLRSSPVFDGRRMYVRGQKHLWCIGR